MKGSIRWYFSLTVVLLAAGCGTGDPSGGGAQTGNSSNQRETADRVAEDKAVAALKELGANIARDEQGRVKVLRLSGPEISDAALEHVARITNLKCLYLIDTRVTDAGFRHLEPLAQLKTLHRVKSGPEQLVVKTLKQSTRVEFPGGFPIEDVLDYLKAYHDIGIRIEEGEGPAFSRNAEVTVGLEGVSFGEALTSIVQPHGAEWAIDPQGIVVFSKQCAATKRSQLMELCRRRPDLKDVIVDW